MTRRPALLICDSREQRPYRFVSLASPVIDFDVRMEKLDAGDYAAALHADDPPEAWAIVERKTLSDLLGTLTAGRDRFVRELERMRSFGFRALVIEASLHDIVEGAGQSKATPQSIVASLLAFAQRFGIHAYFAGDRRLAEVLTFRILDRWVRDTVDGKRKGAAA